MLWRDYRDASPPPAGELSLRVRGDMNMVRDPIGERPAAKIEMADELTLFIHGFNVSHDAAIDAYTEMTRQLPPEMRETLYWVQWPGNASEATLLSAASYPMMIARAETCALVMSDLLLVHRNRPATRGPLRLRIIAHSLGCRLTMQFLRDIGMLYRGSAPKKVDVELVILMAAAIPSEMVHSGAFLDLSKLAGTRTLILHSKRDMVLFGVFPFGQMFETKDLLTRFQRRGALGRHGYAAAAPAGLEIESEKLKLGHGDYWADDEVAGIVAEELQALSASSRARMLSGVDDVKGREAPGRTSPAGRPDPVGRR